MACSGSSRWQVGRSRTRNQSSDINPILFIQHFSVETECIKRGTGCDVRMNHGNTDLNSNFDAAICLLYDMRQLLKLFEHFCYL